MPRSQKWFKAMQQHVSPNQKRIFNEYWPMYGINLKYGTKIVPHELFPNISASLTTPVCLDIGFGTGDSIIGMSQQNKDKIYLGCEIHRAGISIALGNITTLGIENVKLIRADVTMLLETYLTDRCLDEVCIFFPDPWVNYERDGGRRVVRKGKSFRRCVIKSRLFFIFSLLKMTFCTS
jgi:tRNA (guanine-N7-)-methyltransferase